MGPWAAVFLLLLLPLPCLGQAPHLPWQVTPPPRPQSPALLAPPPVGVAGLQPRPLLPRLPSLQQHLAWAGGQSGGQTVGQWGGGAGWSWGGQPRPDPRRQALATAWGLLSGRRREAMMLGVSLAFMTGRFNVLLCPLVVRDLWPGPRTAATPEAAVLECLPAPACATIRQMSLSLCQSRHSSCGLALQLSQVCQALHPPPPQGVISPPQTPSQAPSQLLPGPPRKPPMPPPRRSQGSRPSPPKPPGLPRPTLPSFWNLFTTPTTPTTPTTTPTTPTTTTTPTSTTTTPTTTTTTTTTTPTTTTPTTTTTTATTTAPTTTTTPATTTIPTTTTVPTTTEKFWTCDDVDDVLNCGFSISKCRWKGSFERDTRGFAFAANRSEAYTYELISSPFKVSQPKCTFYYQIWYHTWVEGEDISISMMEDNGGTLTKVRDIYDPSLYGRPAAFWTRRTANLTQTDNLVRLLFQFDMKPGLKPIGLDAFFVAP